MDRRSFLTLLAASPLLAKIGKLELEPEPVAAFAPEAIAEASPLVVAPTNLRVAMFALPFSADEGFNPVVEAGRIARFVALPQRPFRPDRLVIAEPDFDILGVSTSGEPQLDEVVPSDLFGVAAFGARLQFHTAAPGSLLVMAVRNKGPTRPFHATMIGRCTYEASPEELERERAMFADLDDELERDFDDDDDDEPSFHDYEDDDA